MHDTGRVTNVHDVNIPTHMRVSHYLASRNKFYASQIIAYRVEFYAFLAVLSVNVEVCIQLFIII